MRNEFHLTVRRIDRRSEERISFHSIAAAEGPRENRNRRRFGGKQTCEPEQREDRRREGAAMRLKFTDKRRESGQSAVELALTLPLLLLLICGMIEMGWISSTRLVLDNITREGVRAGIIAKSASTNTTDVIERINEMKPDYMTGTLNVTVSYSDTADFREGDITVVTTYDLPPLTPLTSFLAEDGYFHLRSSCTMKMS